MKGKPQYRREKIKCIRLADDTVLVVEDTQVLQGFVTLREEGMEAYIMKIKVKKLKK